MAGRRRQRRALTQLPRISLTPLIDAVLVLLIIFMVCAPVVQNAIKVELPYGTAKEAAAQQDDVIVSLSADRKLYVAKEPVTAATLVDAVKKKMKNSSTPVYIMADSSVSYGDVVELTVDRLKAGGIKYVALPTQAKVKRAA